jgi:hypothetical protein
MQLSEQWAHEPIDSEICRVHLPMNTEGCFHVLQALVGEVFEAVDVVNRETRAPDVSLAVVGEHLLSAAFVAVPGSVGDEDRPLAASATQGFCQRPLVVLGIMKRAVIDNKVELIVDERETIDIGLEAREESCKMLFVVDGGSQPITVVGE